MQISTGSAQNHLGVHHREFACRPGSHFDSGSAQRLFGGAKLRLQAGPEKRPRTYDLEHLGCISGPDAPRARLEMQNREVGSERTPEHSKAFDTPRVRLEVQNSKFAARPGKILRYAK